MIISAGLFFSFRQHCLVIKPLKVIDQAKLCVFLPKGRHLGFRVRPVPFSQVWVHYLKYIHKVQEVVYQCWLTIQKINQKGHHIKMSVSVMTIERH